MFKDTKAYSGFAVPDLEQAQEFYGEKLGLELTDANEYFFSIKLSGDRDTMVYAKPDHEPANYTILNFQVDDVEKAVDELGERGIELEKYDGFEQDDKGIARGEGPNIAWFKDPAGNILSVHED